MGPEAYNPQLFCAVENDEGRILRYESFVTLRDLLAGLAVSGSVGLHTPAEAARAAYALADAMLVERNR